MKSFSYVIPDAVGIHARPAGMLVKEVKKYFGDKVFKTVIPRNVRLAEAPSYGLPGVLYDKSSKGAKAYQEFGAEFLKRMKKYKKQSREV